MDLAVEVVLRVAADEPAGKGWTDGDEDLSAGVELTRLAADKSSRDEAAARVDRIASGI